MIESIRWHCHSVVHPLHCTARETQALIVTTEQRIVHKQLHGTKLTNLDIAYASCLHKRTSNVFKDSTHPEDCLCQSKDSTNTPLAADLLSHFYCLLSFLILHYSGQSEIEQFIYFFFVFYSQLNRLPMSKKLPYNMYIL